MFLLQAFQSASIPLVDEYVRLDREAMEAMVDAGLAKHLGVSNFSLAQVRRESDLQRCCCAHKITEACYSQISAGLFAPRSRQIRMLCGPV